MQGPQRPGSQSGEGRSNVPTSRGTLRDPRLVFMDPQLEGARLVRPLPLRWGRGSRRGLAYGPPGDSSRPDRSSWSWLLDQFSLSVAFLWFWGPNLRYKQGDPLMYYPKQRERGRY